MSLTVQQTLRETSQQLQSETAQLDAELLLCHVLDVNRTWLRTWPEKEITEAQAAQISRLVSRRNQGEPIAYILGNQEFWSLLLKVTPDTLIPRPETELLVEQALHVLQGMQQPHVIDLGTGSGAIALAIASEQPDAQVVATDYSAAALRIAQENARALGLSNVRFEHTSWLEGFPADSFDLIVSNPPYIDETDTDIALDVKKYEPHAALFAGEEGLSDIRMIIEQSRNVLRDQGWLMFEHGWKQAEAVRNLLVQYGFVEVRTLKDLAGHDRVTLAQKKG